MKLERDQYWMYTNDQDVTILVWITETGIKHENGQDQSTTSRWSSIHKHEIACMFSSDSIKARLWEGNNLQLIDREKANMLISLWAPYDKVKSK